MTSNNSTKTKQNQYKKPTRLATAIFLFGSLALFFMVYFSFFGLSVAEFNKGNIIELENGKSASVITLDGEKEKVNIEKGVVDSVTVEVKKYYTNDLLIEDGEGKASIGTTPVNKKTIKIENSKKTVKLNNKKNKNTAIITLDVKSSQGPTIILKIISGSLILFAISLFSLIADFFYYKIRNKNLFIKNLI